MNTATETESIRPDISWLVRIPEIFEGLASSVLRRLGAVSNKRLGQDYYWIKTASPEAIRHSEAAKFIRWNVPLDHAWPCHPQKMEGFIEKAAQTLLRKFGERMPQGIFMGQLNPGSPDKYYKSLASNLRGRTLQIFPKLNAATVEEQDPAASTLFCLVGKEGLFCGMQSPRESNGLYAGGSMYVAQDSPDTISRAGAKVAEALHYLLMHRAPLKPGSHWVELGASPGGMTSELLSRGQRVTAIDRAPLDQRLHHLPNLKFVRSDVTAFEPKAGEIYDAILSDLNGPAEESIRHVVRLSRYLKNRGLVIFTLKVPDIATLDEPGALTRTVVKQAFEAGLSLIAQTHLTYNRQEFTLFLEMNRD